jgi:hypothetical protein
MNENKCNQNEKDLTILSPWPVLPSQPDPAVVKNCGKDLCIFLGSHCSMQKTYSHLLAYQETLLLSNTVWFGSGTFHYQWCKQASVHVSQKVRVLHAKCAHRMVSVCEMFFGTIATSLSFTIKNCCF